MRNANANLMKEMNLNTIREVMQQLETATKPQLSSLTNLSVVTVNSLVKELHERGELIEDRIVPSNGGRPAQTYRYHYDFNLALVLYLQEKQGQELVSASVINLNGEVKSNEEYLVPVIGKEFFYNVISYFLQKYPLIKNIGLGIPGQEVNGEITVSSHQELRGSRIIKEIENEFGLKVLVENDVNAAINGYCMRQKEKEVKCIIGIYFPNKYPPGMGIILDGRVVRGKHGMSGEIKFLPGSPNWSSELTINAFMDAAFRIIQTVNAVLAPDKVVIYQNRVEEGSWEAAWGLFQDDHPMPSYPEIILQHSFQEDFELGLIRVTLKAMQQDLTKLP